MGVQQKDIKALYREKLSSLFFMESTEVKHQLSAVESELEKVSSDAGEPLSSMLQHIFRAGGKRIRPLLVMKCGQCFNEEITNDLLRTAVGFELIHIASLIHDDIIDKSDIRHKAPTLNSLWGVQYSTLAGDFVFAKAFEILVKGRLFDCLDLMIDSIKHMCDGEIGQQEQKFVSATSIQDYYERIRKKTGCLITNCCKAGAVISTNNPVYLDSIDKYGTSIGYAFQIIDDILDFTGKASITGKPVGMDLFQGNVTLPVILLNRNSEYTMFLNSLMESEKAYMSHFPKLVRLLHETGVMDECYHIAREHINTAKRSIRKVPQSRHRIFMEQLADMIVERLH